MATSSCSKTPAAYRGVAGIIGGGVAGIVLGLGLGRFAYYEWEKTPHNWLDFGPMWTLILPPALGLAGVGLGGYLAARTPECKVGRR
jgi:hypothetical protein